MGIVLDQIGKAERRAQEIDLGAVVSNAKGKAPKDLADASQKARRLQYLNESLDDLQSATIQFERIIGGNELQDVNYLARGEKAARSIARIAIRAPSGEQIGWGTGFLVGPGVLLTNHHVFPQAQLAVRSEAQFDVERDIHGRPKPTCIFELAPDVLFYAHEELDFAVVAVRERSANTGGSVLEYGSLPLVGQTGKVAEGEWLTIVQHPNGELKQLCARENKLIKCADTVLWYSTDTLGGSSGSPVFNNDWCVVALHHSGVPERRDGVIQTIDGAAYDPSVDPDGTRIKWVANEGIRVSKIVDQIKTIVGQFPLLKPVVSATPRSARLALTNAHPQLTPDNRTTAMTTPAVTDASRVVKVTLNIDSAGRVSISDQEAGPLESVAFGEAKKRGKKPASFDVPFDLDYSKRKGYQADFLGKGFEVNLPELSPALQHEAAPRLDVKGKNSYVLDYHNYSLVMHAKRRFAIYTAANVRFDQRYEMNRPPDVWRTDPRIAMEHQITDFYYKNNNFDRGHLTRREDLEYGSTAMDALASAADTCHWTNCTPQHSKFNQNKELWQGIERYVLENVITQGQYNTQVLTGPILEEDDPTWDRFDDIQYPVRFWKVVATRNANGQLCATAYILDQSDVVAEFGIEAAVEAPFGAYKTFQVKISEVERLTGLRFTSGHGAKKQSLSAVDPLQVSKPRSRRARGARLQESAMTAAPEGYVLLEDIRDVWLGE